MQEEKLPKITAWGQKIAKECDSAWNALLATHFESQEDFDEAFVQMNLALEKEPRNNNLYEKMVWIAHPAEKLDQAKELVQSALSNSSGNHMLWRCSGLIQLLKEEYLAAVKDLRESLKLKDDERVTHFLLGFSLLALLEKGNGSFISGSDLLGTAQDELGKASDMPLTKQDPEFEQGMKLLNEKLFSRALEKMRSVLNGIRQLQVEPASFSYLALDFLMDEKKVEQNEVESTINELRERAEQGKEYPEINNHLGLCFLIFWRNLVFEAKNQLRLAVEKDAKFQKAKTNLMFLDSSERRISALMKELRF